jgi:hypothetical protein
MSSKIPPVLKGGGGGAEGVHEKMEGWRGEGLKLEVRDRGLIPVSRTGRAKTICMLLCSVGSCTDKNTGRLVNHSLVFST